MLTSRLYQPLDTHHRFFVEPYVQLENERHDIYLDGDRWARYFVRQLFTEIDAGINIGTHAQLRAGIRRGWIEADLDTGIPGFPELDPEIDTSLQLRATYDTRDSVGLPTRGTFVSTRYVHSDDWWDGKQDYKLLEGVVSHSFSFRGNSLSVTAAGGRALDGDPPITQSFRLGGIRTFPGLKPGELRSDNYWFAGATYLWRLVDSQPLSNGALFAGLRFQAGEARDRFDEIDDGTLYGLSGSVSGGTPIGPFTLSLGFVSNGSALIQFTLGRPIAEGSILDELQ
jgi:outer membrane protein assembly factor BamA